MKRKFKKATVALMAVLTVTTCAVLASAAGVNDTSKDSSSFSMSNGIAEIISKKETEFENERSNGALTSAQTSVNTQKVSAEDGIVKIKDIKETLYKNSSVLAIIDIKARINAPIVKGNADVEIESSNITNLDGVKAKYVKIYEFSYNHPFHVNLNSIAKNATINYMGKEIIFTNGRKNYTVDGEKYSMEGRAPIIINNRIIVPLKTLVEATGVED